MQSMVKFQYMLWRECVKDLLEAHGNQFADIIITVYLILLFTDGTSKRIAVDVCHSGLVTQQNFYLLRDSLLNYMLYPYYFDNCCTHYYSNVHVCKFNCIKKIVIHNK